MKIYYYMTVMIGVVLLLQFSGIQTPMNGFFDFVGVTFDENNTINSTRLDSSTLWNDIFKTDGDDIGILAVLIAGAGAFGVAALAGVRGENLILTPFVVGSLTLFGVTMTSIITHAISLGNTWIASIMCLILVPFAVGFTFATIEWWRGTD